MNATWKTKWNLPYESAWGRFERLKYANWATDWTFGVRTDRGFAPGKELCQPGLSGRSEAVVKELIAPSEEDLSVWRTIATAERILGCKALPPLWLRETRFCPECLRRGYHSVFHQLAFVDRCPVHDLPLERMGTTFRKTSREPFTDDEGTELPVAGVGEAFSGLEEFSAEIRRAVADPEIPAFVLAARGVVVDGWSGALEPVDARDETETDLSAFALPYAERAVGSFALEDLEKVRKTVPWFDGDAVAETRKRIVDAARSRVAERLLAGADPFDALEEDASTVWIVTRRPTSGELGLRRACGRNDGPWTAENLRALAEGRQDEVTALGIKKWTVARVSWWLRTDAPPRATGRTRSSKS